MKESTKYIDIKIQKQNREEAVLEEDKAKIFLILWKLVLIYLIMYNLSICRQNLKTYLHCIKIEKIDKYSAIFVLEHI